MGLRETAAYQLLRTRVESCAQERRSAWGMAQTVDGYIRLLRSGVEHATLARGMYAQGIPYEVQRRVLAGQATIRHRE